MYVHDLPEGMDSYMNMFAVMMEMKSGKNCMNLYGDLNRLQSWCDTFDIIQPKQMESNEDETK